MRMRSGATPLSIRRRRTASARRSDSCWLWRRAPASSAWPSTVTRRYAMAREPGRLRLQRRAGARAELGAAFAEEYPVADLGLELAGGTPAMPSCMRSSAVRRGAIMAAAGCSCTAPQSAMTLPDRPPECMERSPARDCLVEGKTAPALGPNFGWRMRGPRPSSSPATLCRSTTAASLRACLAAVEHGLRAAVLRPAGNVVADRHRPLLAVGDGADALAR